MVSFASVIDLVSSHNKSPCHYVLMIFLCMIATVLVMTVVYFFTVIMGLLSTIVIYYGRYDVKTGHVTDLLSLEDYYQVQCSVSSLKTLAIGCILPGIPMDIIIIALLIVVYKICY